MIRSLVSQFFDTIHFYLIRIGINSVIFSDKIRGGTMVEQLKFLQEYMRPWLLEANLKASNIVGQYGFDV